MMKVPSQDVENPRRRSIDSVTHWRTLRASLELRARGLEAALRGVRWDSPGSDGDQSRAIDRRYERLLKLRQLQAKLYTRERLAAEAIKDGTDRRGIRRA